MREREEAVPPELAAPAALDASMASGSGT